MGSSSAQVHNAGFVQKTNDRGLMPSNKGTQREAQPKKLRMTFKIRLARQIDWSGSACEPAHV